MNLRVAAILATFWTSCAIAQTPSQPMVPSGTGGSSLATPVSGANGGTGVANTGSTITLGASVVTTGAGAPTLAFPATPQTYTFPTTAASLARTDAGQTFTGTNIFGINQVTSEAIGGCTIGVQVFCTTGAGVMGNGTGAQIIDGVGVLLKFVNTEVARLPSSTEFRLTTPSSLSWNGDTFMSRFSAAVIQHGAADAAAPVAQMIKFQSVIAGTSNTAGADASIVASAGTGTGIGGKLILKTAITGTTGTTQNSSFPLVSLNPGSATTSTVQFGDGTNVTTYDSCTTLTTGATGVMACTASAMRFKNLLDVVSPQLASIGLDNLRTGAPVWDYRGEYKQRFGDGPRVGLIADDVAKMDERCVTRDEDGQIKDYWDRCVIAYLVADRQAKDARLSKMEAEIAELKRRH